MRVRRFELRLLAGVLAVAWALFAGLVLVLYRPGGPADLVVAVVAGVPTAIALAALAWPPVARSTPAFAAIVWLGLGVALVLLPSIGGLLAQLEAGGTQTLLPSVESAYPWLLALGGTSLFAGLGFARHRVGESALRGRRVAFALVVALALTAVTGSLFAVAAIGNDLALRDRPAAASRFGPTDPRLPLPGCDAALVVPATAFVTTSLDGSVDGRSLGTASISGSRSGGNARAELSVATVLELEQRGAARIGDAAFALRSGRWTSATPAAVASDLALDDTVLATALDRRNRAAAEFHGEEFVEGARARHCRTATDGRTFRSAFPVTASLVGTADLHRWRGQLDYWVFADGALGRLSGSINGDAAGLPTSGILGTIRVQMTIVDRGRPLSIPTPQVR